MVRAGRRTYVTAWLTSRTWACVAGRGQGTGSDGPQGTQPLRGRVRAHRREQRPLRVRRPGDADADVDHRPEHSRQPHRLRQRRLLPADRLRPRRESSAGIADSCRDRTPTRRTWPRSGRHRAAGPHRDRAPELQEERRAVLEPPAGLAGVRPGRRPHLLLRLAVRRDTGAGALGAPAEDRDALEHEVARRTADLVRSEERVRFILKAGGWARSPRPRPMCISPSPTPAR